MGQPVATPQTAETGNLFGVGPHDAYCGLSVPSDLTGEVHVALYVHDSAAPKTLRVVQKVQLLFSDGAIVDTQQTATPYRQASWMLSSVSFAVASGDIVVTFDGVVGATVDAATVARMVET